MTKILMTKFYPIPNLLIDSQVMKVIAGSME